MVQADVRRGAGHAVNARHAAIGTADDTWDHTSHVNDPAIALTQGKLPLFSEMT